MGFMDSVSVFTKGVGAKAKGNYDVVAMSAQIASIKREINELYMKIGEIYYREMSQSPDDSLAALVNEVTSRINSIEDLNNQIEVTKAEAAAVQLTVPKAEIKREQAVSGRVCQKCGAPLADDDIFCSECGERNDIPEEADNVNQPEEILAEEAHEDNKKYCPSCGQELGIDDMFCPECGQKVE